jgi:2-octaprenyl-6-methoxyphenol hydroxylase
MTERVDIAIVGGGLAGPALGAALAQAGFTVALFDALPAPTRADPGFDGRAYAVAAASRRFLAAIGTWPGDAAQPIQGIRVTDGRAGEGAGPLGLAFSSAEIEDGPMGHVIEDRHLRAALAAALDGVQVRDGVAVTGQVVTPGGVDLTLSDRTLCRAALVVGADGRGSGTAARAGIGRRVRDYGQTALVCAVAHERPHQGIAHQFFMPGGPLAILPLPGDRSAIVWSEERNRAEAAMATDDAAFLDLLRPAFGSFLGDLALQGRRFAYPLGLSLAQRLTAPRVALVGDAAHGVHPIAGQGLNAGFRDIAALVDVLTEARGRGEDIGSDAVLDRYARWRRFDIFALATATDGFNRLFSNDNPVLRLVRGLGLGAVNALPPLRRSFIREAAGLTGDLPSMMR